MNWPPIAIKQESKAGLNDPAPDVLVACWAQQVVGFVFPPVSTMTAATLRFVVPDDGVTRQVAVSVELCEVVGDLPSTWAVVGGRALRVTDVESGAAVAMDIPLSGMMSAGSWGIRVKSLEPRADNLQMVRDSVGVELTFAEPSPGPVGGPYADILESIGATAADRIQVVVHSDGTAQRRVLLDVGAHEWAAMIVDDGEPLVTYRGEVDG